MKENDNNRWFCGSRWSLGMKMTVLLLLVTQIAFSSGKSWAQQSVSVRFVNSSLTEVLRMLKQKTTFEFLYNDEEVRNVRDLTGNFEEVSVEEVLDACLAGTGYGYKIVNNLIVITPGAQVAEPQAAYVIKGKVMDEQGEPLPGATIVIKGLKIGVASDINGDFAIEVPSSDVILSITFVGMQPQEISLKNMKDLSKELTIKMRPDAMQMEEVVVTGYGNIKKHSFTGSSISVKGEELLKVSQTNVISALQTFDPSFRIQVNNQWGSDPNALPEMYVRGRSGIGVKELEKDPLSKSSLENNPNLPTFIMDGFEVSVEKVYDLDPTRIESMTILKDAAATAMYGSRAANGVVVITTIAPKPGEIRVSYGFTGSLTLPDLSDYNLADAAEKLEIERLSGVYDPENYLENNLAFAMKEYNQRYQRIQEGVNTDWLAIPLRNAFDHKHSLYIEGGNKDLRYGLDAQYNNAAGVMKDSYRRRAGVGFFLDYTLKNFRVKNYISYTYMKAQDSPYGSFSDYSKLQPYDRPYDYNGVLVKKLEFSSLNRNAGANNPLYEAMLNNFSFNKYDEFIDNFSINWQLNNYLVLKGQFSVTKKFNKGERFVDPLSSKVSVADSRDENIKNLTGDLYLTTSEDTRWDANAFLYYQQTVAKNNINFSVGINSTSTAAVNTSTHYRGFPSGELHSPNYAAEVYEKPTKAESLSRLFGFIASLNYTYDDIYLLDASVRLDGSSEFGDNQKWAPFWSGGVGINIHNYGFLKGSDWLNQLKIRTSYGQTGKVNFPPYCARTTYEAQTDEWYQTGYGVLLKALGNPDLSWETTNKFNVGADVQLFGGRLTLSGEYYYDKTVDLITDVTIPTSSGFKSYKDNLGEVENKGFEIQLRADILRKQDYTLSLWGNMAHNKNKILKISESLKAYNDQVNDYYADAEEGGADKGSYDQKYSKPIPKYEEGGSLTSIFAMKSLGIDPTNGKEIFVNRDGTITHTWSASQEVIVGNTEPKAQGSFGLNASYKDLTLFVSFMYEFGAQQYNNTLVNDVECADVKYKNVDKRVLTDRWQKPGDIAPLKDIRDRNAATLPSSRFVQDYNLLSLSAITVSYDLDRNWIKKLGMSMLRLEVSSSDITRFCSVKQERGLDYPFARTINFSLKANF